ncbi:MAG: hypothetical protein A2636_02245 [Elusimicrobia bacterium RIFCSPHIGHO2_01_FULL_64_10]|nr:MAG: hypothetical protein A2636_02245 [Elusimicrobia bacterium RIFCSPHIGHO2_01_FULL_64_10]
MDVLAKRQNAAFWIFLVSWGLILFLNKAVGFPACWFYSDAQGEYSLAEIMTLIYYLFSVTILAFFAHKHKDRRFILPALFLFWLFLEEANYGQILLGRSGSNYVYDAEQLSIHTAYFRTLDVTRRLDLAEIFEYILEAVFAVGVPLILKRYFKMMIKPAVLWLPLAFFIFCNAANALGFLTPWECGGDSFDEIIETLLATTAFYYCCLLDFHFVAVKDGEVQPQGKKISSSFIKNLVKY